jgi:NAD(P)-dependent dehydrogenase (short-subunit alcohol dehydrogenase family)
MAAARAVLVTGCSSGIGRATALGLARAGFVTYASARRVDDQAELAAAGCHTVALDVQDEASMRAAVDAISREHPALYGLVNNAGYSQSGALATLPMEKVRAQFETNIFGLLRLTQLVIPGMRRAGEGRIVNIGSMGGVLSFPGAGVYHATKHALEALSDVLRFELSATGIDVVLVQPGPIKTGYAARVVKEMPAGASGDPFAAFNAAVSTGTVNAYEHGPLAVMGGGPDDVARVVEKALKAARPRARYKVTIAAHVLMRLRRSLPDRWWDAFLRSQSREFVKTLPGKG